jgi:hypothetical protein
VFGRGAQRILTIDAEAARRNRKRFGIEIVVVGSPRHSSYAALDIPEIRRKVRETLGVKSGQALLGYFGQALHRMAGYRRTVEALIAVLKGMDALPLVGLRRHPRESREQREESVRFFSDAGIPTVMLEDRPVEEALIACDVVCSLFSTCTYDTAYLNRFSPAPVAVPLSLLFDEEVAGYCRQHVHFETFPYHTAGIVRAVYQKERLPTDLTAAFAPSERELVWRSAREFLPDPAGAPARILDEIAGFVQSSGNAGR